nr:hypothetical protein B0A51_13483 [Rachicladosporium sp. CCFEE 5018]OQO30811.1 hypothetical protein B0A51_01472 [Rachicladosporium sp. CCFEE 5018]
MPPKNSSGSSVWVVTSAPDRESEGVVYSVNASETDASNAAKAQDAYVFKYDVMKSSASTKEKTAKSATGTKKTSKSPSVVAEDDEDDDMEDDVDEDANAAKKAAAAEKKATADATKADTAAKAKEKKDARKTIPQGVPNALGGLTILFTGTFELDRKSCEAAAVKYGATLSKKIADCDYVILGAKPGPKKLVEIDDDNIKTATESEFFEWVVEGGPNYSGPPAKKQKV